MLHAAAILFLCPVFRTVEVIVGQPDEALSTDNEIFTRTTSAETREPASISGVDRSQGVSIFISTFNKHRWFCSSKT